MRDNKSQSFSSDLGWIDENDAETLGLFKKKKASFFVERKTNTSALNSLVWMGPQCISTFLDGLQVVAPATGRSFISGSHRDFEVIRLSIVTILLLQYY